MCFFADSGASSHMMEISSLIEQEKRTVRRSSRALQIQTVNGSVTTDTSSESVHQGAVCSCMGVFG